MPRRRLSLRIQDAAVVAEARAAFGRIRAELEIPQSFPPDVLAAADEVAGQGPGSGRPPAYDLTDLPFFTIDPPGSTDLDQAMHLERRDHGYRVRYAIADVGACIAPGGPIDREAHRRGLTYYSPDLRVPLHPPVLSEGAASLLPDQERLAVVWTFDLDSDGEQRAVDVRRALVRSRDRLDYTGVQRSVDDGDGDDRLLLLRDIGRLRQQLQVERGGINLPIPEQEVVESDGGFHLVYRQPVEAEEWNEQISLLTGIAAADLMLHGGVGVLRTLPEPPAEALVVLRRSALALGVEWPESAAYAEVAASLDAADPRHAAFLQDATTLLRGVGYTAFDGTVPELSMHAGVAAAYAHATAPLRRLVDRYVSEICLAVCAGQEVPDWTRSALADLPKEMGEADRRAGALERECVSLMEAMVLRDRIGDTFEAVVIDVTGDGGTVQLAEPAVRAPYTGELPLGERVQVRLEEADVSRRSVRFGPA